MAGEDQGENGAKRKMLRMKKDHDYVIILPTKVSFVIIITLFFDSITRMLVQVR